MRSIYRYLLMKVEGVCEIEEKQVLSTEEEETEQKLEKEEEERERDSSPTEKEMGEVEEQSSPRGILEVQVLSSDSEHSGSTGSSQGTNSFKSEKSLVVVRKGFTAESESGNGNFQWKKFLLKRLLSFPLLSKKMPRKLEGNRSFDEAIDCGNFMVPKPSWRNFSYEELKQATGDFSADKLIGKGGHAEVYRGCLSDGEVVAVKKIMKGKKTDEDKVRDYLTELGIIAHIDHPNAAKLIGFSADMGLFLVLQFAPHGSLGTVLHGSEECMEWKIRYKVAIGVAEGLLYLHRDCQRRVIHRDITASNILLSEEYEAKISDFGLAKWLPEKWVHIVASPIEGTFGYMAPEYFMHGIVHEKIDVFAYGVLLLELITGRRAIVSSRQSLVMWAKPLLEAKNIKELADPRLGESYDAYEMKRAMYTASSCIHHMPSMRPNMERVVQLLKVENADSDNWQRSMGGRALMLDACDLEDYSSDAYLKDLNRHMELAME